ncbi:MAG: NAD-dependent epimerase/dehydratase family protein, partial [Myxococcota bacterium]
MSDLRRSLEGRRVLVTGANGFMGSHLVRRLLAQGDRRHTSEL